jgi:DNA-binding transcriptional LysR family regulator
LSVIRHIVCATPNYLRKHGTPEIPRDLVRHNCLIMTQPVPAHEWPFVKGARRQLVAVSGNFRADTMEALYHAVMKGIGIARVPNYVVGPELQTGQLISLFDNATSQAVMTANYLKGRYLDLKTHAFVSFLRERFDANYDWTRRDGVF